MIYPIRTENQKDFEAVSVLIQNAFEHEEHSDHREHLLVERLRKSPSFVPGLSLVAEAESKIAGHILLTEIRIKNESAETLSLALAPVAVLQEYQGKGIGSALITSAHQKAKELGYNSVVLLGHADYYPRFGYQQAHHFGIQLPFDVPLENCMVIELVKGSLQGVSGMVEYPEEFYR
ncbi:GNAT family N-acetyltransferase [Elizabethkingia meningoseptica]|uniref:GNAT family N-acetyltransferase n=1 Tax=Elizabethkingia meningoseptica TaxID=238 RepID=UPI003892BBBF